MNKFIWGMVLGMWIGFLLDLFRPEIRNFLGWL